MDKLAIVIPTYNEAENIEELISSILKIYPGVQIVIVDDNSPDATAQKVLEISKKNKAVHCLVRKENRGRGLAGIAAFKYALGLDVEYIMEMDADFSHDPKYIPEFLKTIKNADVVIGSRFVKEGADSQRDMLRKLISIFANFYLRSLLKVNIRDCTSGYRCFRREVLEKIEIDSLSAKGPEIIEEILYRCRDFKIKEIPIQFNKRKAGQTKLTLKGLIHCFVIPWKIRYIKRADV